MSLSNGQVNNGCKWFHGTHPRALPLIARHGLLSPNRLRQIGQTIRYYDSRNNMVYLTSDIGVANLFGHVLTLDNFAPSLVLCTGPIKVERRDRNGDVQSVEVLHKIRPEYLRIHNHEQSGVCWPLLWWANESRII